MGESRINDQNYYQVSGWMITRLGLKGTSLQLYAIIYGFTQDGKNVFDGSLTYLEDFTNTSRPTVVKALKELVAKGLLRKKARIENGVKYVTYQADQRAVERYLGGSKETLPGVVKNLSEGSKETLPGVVKNLSEGGKETLPNKEIDNKVSLYISIVDYLNKKAGTKYKHTREKTREHINARLAEGHTVEDFFKVIDNKCTEWLGTEFEKYLRPDTLFGNKFEGYLNSKPTPPKPGKQGGKPAPTDYGSPEDFYN